MSSSSTDAVTDTFHSPIDDRWFEDYRPGAVHECGRVSVTEDQILAFAREYDPQPIHIDRDAAESGPYGGLIASGWQTAGLMMRLLVDHYLSRVASLGGPGADELRWFRPVRAGDALRLRATVMSAKPSSSRPDRGMVTTLAELIDDDDRVVFRVTALNLLRRRPSSQGEPAE